MEKKDHKNLKGISRSQDYNLYASPISDMGPGPMLEMGPIWSDLQDGTRSDAEDSSCKEEKVEDFILKPEKLMETKKLRAASPLSLSIFWAKKNNSPLVWGRLQRSRVP